MAALGGDYALYFGAIGLVSMATILPAFAERLGASNLVIGAIPALIWVGWLAPGILAASYTEGLARKFPFVLKYTPVERLPLLLIAVLALALATSHPGLVLVGFLLLLAVWAVAGGVLLPAWLDLIGRVIPMRLRGRFFAVSHAVGGILGMGGAALAGYFLATYPFPLNYALCFATAFGATAVGFVAFTLAKEPAMPAPPAPPPLTTYLRRLPAVMAGHPNFAWYLVARGLGIAGLLVAAGFYTVYAIRELGAPEPHVGLFTFVLLASGTASTLALGPLADRAGHKRVITLSAVAAAAANLVALTVVGVDQFALVFALLGAAWAAVDVSAMAILLEFASEHDRPTYVALGHLALVPFALVAPLLGGWLADQIGYAIVFGLGAGLGVASGLLLTFRVRDPRAA